MRARDKALQEWTEMQRAPLLDRIEALEIALKAACELGSDGRAYFRTMGGLPMGMPRRAERLVREQLKKAQEQP
jgi:hypothetical protein